MNPDAPNPFDDVSRRGFDHEAVERFPWPVVAGYAEVHCWMGAGLAVHAEGAREYLDRPHDAFDLRRNLLSAMTLESDDPAGGPPTWGCQSPPPFYLRAGRPEVPTGRLPRRP